MDRIYIKDLEVFANHGVYPEENKLGQKFVISADLSVDVRMAGLTDELEYSVNYGEVSHTIQDFLQKHTFKLIEAAAEGLAAELFCKYPLIRALRLEIQKPWAPVGLQLRTVSVEIRRSRHTVYIALGSNMGDKMAYLKEAVEKLSKLPGSSVKKVSDFIRTEPYGVTEQDEFLNVSSGGDRVLWIWIFCCMIRRSSTQKSCIFRILICRTGILSWCRSLRSHRGYVIRF